jgi:SWI/SNF-related matrix-associated actin-dependent regulator of chromatin subfamily A member 5
MLITLFCFSAHILSYCSQWTGGLHKHHDKDEMGLGKTLQSISVLVYQHQFQQCDGPHLVVVPKSTLSNWMNEIARWAPTLKAFCFHGEKQERATMIKDVMQPAIYNDMDRTWNICVTTYEVCNTEKVLLSKFAWNYLIIDEAHRLKNEQSLFSKTVRTFETKYRLLLTGKY